MGQLKVALFAAAMGACLVMPAAAAGPQMVGGLTMMGPVEAAHPVNFDVMLPLHDVGKLEALVQAQTDPNSPQYHKWLTPAQFGAKFGPDAATKARVVAYLQSRGFNVVKIETRSVRATDLNCRMLINAVDPVTALNPAELRPNWPKPLLDSEPGMSAVLQGFRGH